jgi:hypothetical protein
MKKILLILILIFGLKSYACNKYDTINQSICPEDSFLFNGVYLKTAGTYYDTFNVSLGCDTFRTLNLSVHPAIALTRIADSFCQGYSYVYNTKTFSTSGTHYDTLNSVNGCDSLIELTLLYKYRPETYPAPRYDTVDSFCIRQIFDFQGKTFSFNTAGLKLIRDTTFGGAANGCDSINFRAVFIRSNSGVGWPINRFACRPYRIVQKDFFNPSVNHLDTTFTTNGLKSVRYQNRFGCDSTVNFWLTLRKADTTTLNRTTCSNQPFFFNGEWLGAGITEPTKIEKRDTLTQTVNGSGGNTARCDSFIFLELQVYPVKYTTIDTSLCENHTYLFKTQNLSAPGTYLDTQKTVHNCDSFITLILRATRRTSSYTFYRKFCSNKTVFFNDMNIDQSGTYKDTLVNAVGCDSFLTMVLTKDTAHNVIVNKSICSYDSFYFDGRYFDTAGTYIATYRNKDGCDSMVTLNLSVFPFRTVTLVRSNLNNIKTDSGYKAYYWFFNEWTQLNTTGHILATNTTGSYHVIAQDENNCRFKSNLYVHNPAGINQKELSGIHIYPIPSGNTLNIEAPSSFEKNTQIHIYSMEGKLVLSQKVILKTSKLSIDLSSLLNGLYILKVESDNNVLERKIEKR